MPFYFQTLLLDLSIDPADVRLLRHRQTAGVDLMALWATDHDRFVDFQAMQRADKRKTFDTAYWAAFAGLGQRTAFLGLYRAKLQRRDVTGLIDPLTRTPIQTPHDIYSCTAHPELVDLARRLFINWGNPRAWNQRGETYKEVVELRARYSDPPFPGLLQLRASLTEIATMPDSWRQRLQEARGVYLLTCPITNEMYVGQVNGGGGFLARWLGYAANGHGGNVKLKRRNPSDYQVAILEVAGSAASDQDIHDMETRWKLKLMTRITGLNAN